MQTKPYFDIILIIPIGPETPAAYVTDTLESFIYYTTSSFKIILLDDSQQGIGSPLKNNFPQADIVTTVKGGGHMAGLYITLAQAYRYAYEKYSFRIIFKLDTDALVIGKGYDKEALEMFGSHPDIGIAGQYPYNYNGTLWDKGWPEARILNGTSTWKYIKRPVANFTLRKLYRQALNNGYKAGESVFGGAYFISFLLVEKLYNTNLLPNYILGKLNLGEDHLFSLLAKALGFQLGNMCSEKLPFGCAWKGLPAAPDQLYNAGKKVIHSTRKWNDMNEDDIRSYFRMKRSANTA